MYIARSPLALLVTDVEPYNQGLSQQLQHACDQPSHKYSYHVDDVISSNNDDDDDDAFYLARSGAYIVKYIGHNSLQERFLYLVCPLMEWLVVW
jgi:hypothetical protein